MSAKARKMAEAIGCELETDGITISVIAPHGKHDGSGLHELTTEIARYAKIADAWQAVCQDIQSEWTECQIVDCEWCN